MPQSISGLRYGLWPVSKSVTNKMVDPVDREAINKAMEFLGGRLTLVQSLTLGEEQSMVAMLVDTIS